MTNDNYHHLCSWRLNRNSDVRIPLFKHPYWVLDRRRDHRRYFLLKSFNLFPMRGQMVLLCNLVGLTSSPPRIAHWRMALKNDGLFSRTQSRNLATLSGDMVTVGRGRGRGRHTAIGCSRKSKFILREIFRRLFTYFLLYRLKAGIFQ